MTHSLLGRLAPHALRAGLPLMLSLAACSLQLPGPAGLSSTTPQGATAGSMAAPSTSPAASPTPTSGPSPTPTAKAAASPTASPGQTAARTGSFPVPRTDWCLAITDCPNPTDEQVARGKRIFEVEAGDVGCAYCHGLDGKGKSEFGAPPNVGKTALDVKGTIQSKDAMSFLNTLSDEDIDAVAAYLQVLALP